MRRRLTFGRRIVLGVLGAGLPALGLLAITNAIAMTDQTRWILFGIASAWWVLGAWSVQRMVVRPLHTLANLLAGIRRGDFSMRSALARPDDPLGVVMLETNTLVETMSAQRIGALEATALLRTVMAEIDVAILAFDEDRKLRLCNRAAERLLGRPKERLQGEAADALGLAEFLDGPAPRTVELAFAGGNGRGELRRTTFRQHGLPHTLVVLADLSRALRQEELTAWRRIVRVLSHEINNSLTPIASAAGSLKRLLDPSKRDLDWEEDLGIGLELIEGRAQALGRFMRAYAKLARLPAPKRREVEVGALVDRVAGLVGEAPITVQRGPQVHVQADPDQLEQLLINLVTNAVDAVREGGTQVTVGWELAGSDLVVRVLDDGPGIVDTANLFVPFFSTKPGGSGIGLPLCRQIAESHGGRLSLVNRDDGRGCEARLELPLGSGQAG